MINSIKSEIERRTGLPASTVDQVLSALGGIVSERYPQYAGMIGPILGIPTTGTSASAGGQPTGAGQGMPDLGAIEGELGKFLGGNAGQQQPPPQEPQR